MSYQPRDNTYTLRVYKGSKENLLAVFPDIRGFRDLDLEIEEGPALSDDLELSETEDRPAPRRRRRLLLEHMPQVDSDPVGVIAANDSEFASNTPELPDSAIGLRQEVRYTEVSSLPGQGSSGQLEGIRTLSE